MKTASRARIDQWSRILRLCVRQVHTGQRQNLPVKPQGPEGHGEKIWVFRHRRSDQIVYSFEEKLDGFHALKQLPFNGKKTKPAKLRKDYWSAMAMIQFPKGQGEVGRSVYQKLRELKHLHEVAWTDGFRYKRPEQFTDAEKKKIAEEKAKGQEYRPVRSKSERGIALNAQRTNSIADMAVVLSGHGNGNKISDAGKPAEGGLELVPVSISWANDQDKEYAEMWSNNVTHGLFEQPAYKSGMDAGSTA
ncbi:hypothetical protein QQS21_009768 [Conoideocrella luteorostrata]|uniref:Large ribosomal subunit protein mL67 n=1 Tax=Conoideocrella luteorostrata TaxID=1105319 RepID=A0AAJ0CGA2_9HYPO|nr:hypothetical protein QQS21_009768 [Conoideocrella luteorostrata]